MGSPRITGSTTQSAAVKTDPQQKTEWLHEITNVMLFKGRGKSIAEIEVDLWKHCL